MNPLEWCPAEQIKALLIIGWFFQVVGVLMILRDIQVSRRAVDPDHKGLLRWLRDLIGRLQFRQTKPQPVIVHGSAAVEAESALNGSAVATPKDLEGVIEQIVSLQATTDARFREFGRALGDQEDGLRTEIQRVRDDLQEGFAKLQIATKALTIERIRVQWWSAGLLLLGISLSTFGSLLSVW